MYRIILLLFLISISVLPVSAISVSMSGSSNGLQSAQSQDYVLTPGSSVSGHTTIWGGNIITDSKVSGSGELTYTSNGVSANVAGEKITADLTVSGDNVNGKATLSGIPFGIDAQPGLAFTGEALAMNPDGTIVSVGSILTGPVITSTGGNANSYKLMGRKWTQADPQIVMSLKDDAVLAATGMTKINVLNAITSDTNVWDAATNQNLFSDSGAQLTTTLNWKYDHVNNMAFTPYAAGSSAIAATGVWYKTQGIPTGQMYPIVESDMTFNSNDKWSTTGEAGKLNFQSVALHELGHTIGLGDLYNSADARQVMYGYYSGVKLTLGNGDATGVWKLYG
jgi:hypothetical protein